MAAHNVGPGPVAFAIDVGGTGIKAALVDAEGDVVETSRMDTPVDRAGNGEAVLDAVAEIVTRLESTNPARQAESGAVVVPGLVDDRNGVARHSANLHWTDLPAAEILTRRTGRRVQLMHDVRAAGLAEVELGAGQQYRNLMVMAIGTGIAGAIFVDRRIYSADGYAGEVGHTVVRPGGVECACGQRGCLEALSSAAAIERRYAELSGGAVEDAGEVIARAVSGDGLAGTVWTDAIENLAIGIAQVISILGPEAIVLGGGLSEAGDLLIDPLRDRLESLLTFQRMPELVRAALGAEAGMLGAALLTRRSSGG